MNTNWHKIYLFFFFIISIFNFVSNIINQKVLTAAFVVLWVLVIVYSFKRKEYKSLTFLWIIKLLFLIYIIYALFTQGIGNINSMDYLVLVINLLDVILLKKAIDYSKKYE